MRVFPFQIESLEDGVDDSVYGLYVHEAHHGAGGAAHFDETALDYVGGAQLSPQMAGNGRHRQQLGQIAFHSSTMGA